MLQLIELWCYLQIRDLEALRLPGTRCWKRYCLKRLQVQMRLL